MNAFQTVSANVTHTFTGLSDVFLISTARSTAGVGGSFTRPFALVAAWCYAGVFYGVQRADDSEALRACEEAMQHAERDSSDTALMFAMYEVGGVLLHRDDARR